MPYAHPEYSLFAARSPSESVGEKGRSPIGSGGVRSTKAATQLPCLPLVDAYGAGGDGTQTKRPRRAHLRYNHVTLTNPL
jgi:hypothetical protein